MKVKIGKFSISAAKEASETAIEGHQLDQDEFDRLLSRLSPLPASPPRALFQEILIEEIDSSRGALMATAALQSHGIFIVPNFLDREQALAGGRAAFAIADQARTAAKEGVQPSDFDLEESGKSDYYSMAESRRTIVNLRRGNDAGMVDIFNFDRVAHEEGDAIRKALGSEKILRLLSTANSGEWQAANLNAYVNQDVTHTRMFHVDSYGVGQVKAFLYMTDVTDLADGPYCYVAGSHQAGPYRDINLALSSASGVFSSTDTPIVDSAKILPILAPAGSLVVSNQSGSHRGVPQEPGHSRAIAVLNILPVGR